ncbi:MAG: hypothetical protein AB7V55_01095 [Oscillospiraceae bacterium]
MHPKLTNHTVMDKKSCHAFLALAWPKNAGPMRWLMLAVAVFAAGYGVFQLVAFGTGQLGYVLAFFVLAGLAVFIGFWGWRLRAGRYTKEQQAAWGGATLEKTVRFYEEGFVQSSRLAELSFGYEQVDTLRGSGQWLLIGMGGSALLLGRGGFVEDSGDFLAFMLEKCPENMKINRALKKEIKTTKNTASK